MTPLVPFERPVRTYAFIGDSQAGAFDGLLLRTESDFAPAVRTKSLWLPGLRPRDFYGEAGFDEMLTRMLWALHVLRPTTADGSPAFVRPAHRVFGNTMNDVAFEVRQREHVLVVCLGIWEVMDIAEESTSGLAIDDAARVTEQRLGPLFAALRALRDAGCTNLYLSQIPPPAKAPEAAYSLHLLYRITEAANTAFARFCSAERIGLVDCWNRLVQDGYQDRRFFKDEIHLNRDGALVVLNRLHELLTSKEQARGEEPTKFGS